MESEIVIRGPYVVDLMTGISTPDIGEVTVPSGTYDEIKIRLDEAKLEDGILAADDSLLGYTLVAEGTFTDEDSVSHGFKLALKFSEDVEIDHPEGVSVPEGKITEIIASLNVDEWFAGVDLAECVANGDLVIDGSDTLIVGDDSQGDDDCDDIVETIKENFRGSDDIAEGEQSDDHGDHSGEDSL